MRQIDPSSGPASLLAGDTMKRCSPGRHAFTLVELLVVIGIIGLLISILLPALNKAREAGRIVKCMSNLRTLGQAALQYSMDNKNCFLPAIIWNDSGADEWPMLLITKKYLPRQNIGNGNGPLSYDSVLVCPSVMEFAQNDTLRDGIRRTKSNFLDPTLWVDSSYGINGCTYRGSELTSSFGQYPALTLPCTAISFSPNIAATPLKKRNATKHSSEMVFMFDGREWNVWASSAGTDIIRTRINGWRHGGWDPSKPDRSGKVNVSYMDGHVETLPRKQLPDKAAADAGAFTNSTAEVLNARFPFPRWRLDQEYGTAGTGQPPPPR
jgi:prepilin-type N-terminal cleavage/methylation domain-containing protein/prepilin-type processing-associated H-X9-DG protein